MHVVASCIVEEQRDEEAAALPLQVAGIASRAKELASGVVMVSHLPLCQSFEGNVTDVTLVAVLNSISFVPSSFSMGISICS